MTAQILNCFPTPIYSTNRNIDITSTEKTTIEELLKEIVNIDSTIRKGV